MVRRRGIGHLVLRFVYLVILIFGALVTLVPFLWSLSTALKPMQEAMAFPPQWLPHPVDWFNFTRIWHIVPLGRWFLNSFIVAGVVTGGNLFFDSLAGYALARIPFKGRHVLHMSIVAMLMIPFQSVMLPIYVFLHFMGLLNSYAGLILPVLILPMGVFLMRQAFLNLPQELEDAAIIDGAGRLRIYFQIALPLVKPTLMTLGLMSFMGSWNNFLLPLLVANSNRLWTLPLGMVMFQQEYFTDWPYLMAASVLATVPIAVLFLLLQRWFIRGVATTGLK